MENLHSGKIFDSWQFPARKTLLHDYAIKCFHLWREEEGQEILCFLPGTEQQQEVKIILKNQEAYFCGKELMEGMLSVWCQDKFEILTCPKDGDLIIPGSDFIRIMSSQRDIFSWERPLLNLLMFLMGLSTQVRDFTQNFKLPIFDTRKTLPGLRFFSKYAAYIGGALNHRWRLEDMVMLKDTHQDLIGGLCNLISEVKILSPNSLICVEVHTLDQLKICYQEKIPWIMVDNIREELPLFLTKIKNFSDWDPLIEISGNIDESFSDDGLEDLFLSSSRVSFLPKRIDLSLKVVL